MQPLSRKGLQPCYEVGDQRCKRFEGVLLIPMLALGFLAVASGQDHPYTFNVGGGPGFPVGDISDFSTRLHLTEDCL